MTFTWFYASKTVSQAAYKNIALFRSHEGISRLYWPEEGQKKGESVYVYIIRPPARRHKELALDTQRGREKYQQGLRSGESKRGRKDGQRGRPLGGVGSWRACGTTFSSPGGSCATSGVLAALVVESCVGIPLTFSRSWLIFFPLLSGR